MPLERTGLHRLSALVPNSLPATQGQRYSNAHNAEAAVDLYERADDGLRCCHGFAQNTIELCSRLLQVELDHGIII
jgi:hypothetical protein